MKLKIQVDPFLVIIKIYLVCLIIWPCPSTKILALVVIITIFLVYVKVSQSREEFFLRNTSMFHISPHTYSLPPSARWSRKLQFLAVLPYRCYLPNLVLTHDAHRTTTDADHNIVYRPKPFDPPLTATEMRQNLS